MNLMRYYNLMKWRKMDFLTPSETKELARMELNLVALFMNRKG